MDKKDRCDCSYCHCTHDENCTCDCCTAKNPHKDHSKKDNDTYLD